MPDYDKFLMRHGVGWVQWLIEQIERTEGVCANTGLSLEDRWAALMGGAQHNRLSA